MKTILAQILFGPSLISASNEGTARSIRTYGAINESISAADGDWFRVTPYGDFPVYVTEHGRRVKLIQHVDRAAADAMVAAFNSLSTQLATLWRGLPIYEGHVDDPEWVQRNPSARKAAVGRLKQLEARDDGLWCRSAFNDAGNGLVRGDAPAYAAHSPHWGLQRTKGPNDPDTRPMELYSLALTNTPNIPGNLLGLNEEVPVTSESYTMNPLIIKLLAALGQTLAADAAPEAIEAAVNAALAKVNSMQSDTTKAVNEATTATAQLKAERNARSEFIVSGAIKGGRIVEANRSEWITALNEATDFGAKAAELEKLTPVINTKSQLGAIGSRKQEASTARINAINSAVEEKKKAGMSHDAAFAAVQKEQPALFAVSS